MIRFFEELSLNAWPALQSHCYDGWIVRLAGGYTKRSNSVSPLYASTIPTLEKIAYCEQFYTAHGLNTVFKITAAAQPEDLDSILDAQGYITDALTSVQTVSLASIAAPTTDAIRIHADLTDSWLDSYCRLNERKSIPAIREVLQNIILPKQFITLNYEGEVAAIGLGVIERGYLSLYDITTAQSVRNRGLGMEMLLHLLRWGKANGAHHAFLAVMCDNPPALRLYQKLGFQEVYRYWYRVKTLKSS
jgi:GNAT superfamily N-acetyltransferase